MHGHGSTVAQATSSSRPNALEVSHAQPDVFGSTLELCRPAYFAVLSASLLPQMRRAVALLLPKDVRTAAWATSRSTSRACPRKEHKLVGLRLPRAVRHRSCLAPPHGPIR